MSVSIIMPVYNGNRFLAMSMGSVFRQTCTDWQLIAIDDGSTDGSVDRLHELRNGDQRVLIASTGGNRGPSAARNQGLSLATGDFIAYLDCDDELYSDYVANIEHFRYAGDVLVFGYDYTYDTHNGNHASGCTGISRAAGLPINPEVPASRRQLYSWDPLPFVDCMFQTNISVPLGIAHHNSVVEQVGGYNEDLWCLEDWEFWKRVARSGARFAFLPIKSGIYYFRKGSRSNSPTLTSPQAALTEERHRHEIELYAPTCSIIKPVNQKVAFVSEHCILDPSSGAAFTSMQVLIQLAVGGMNCQAFCESKLDLENETVIEQCLEGYGLEYVTQPITKDKPRGRILHTKVGQIAISVVRTVLTRSERVIPGEIEAFLTAADRFLYRFEPKVVLTYGGGIAGYSVRKLCRRRDIAVVFALHNFSYFDPSPFMDVDYVIVPSQFSRDWYWDRLGLHCNVLPNVIDPKRVVAGKREPKYLTFVNPQPAKGVFVVARIIEQLALRRPDIPVLIVESRGRAKDLERTGLDLSWCRNMFFMKNTHDPRKFYRVSKAVIMPSLWNESFGLVAAEAMANGIPVLASNRGALPEIVEEAGFLFDIPERYTPATAVVPTAEEVQPWIDTICRLWDDQAFYSGISQKARLHARQWHPDRLGPLYAEFFRNVHPQPGPPLVPRQLLDEPLPSPT